MVLAGPPRPPGIDLSDSVRVPILVAPRQLGYKIVVVVIAVHVDGCPVDGCKVCCATLGVTCRA